MFVNLTPHDIVVLNSDNSVALTLNPSGLVRLTESVKPNPAIHEGIPIKSVGLGDVLGLPDPIDNVYYVVSMVVATSLRGLRTDLVYPEVVRNDKGIIIGCCGFIAPV